MISWKLFGRVSALMVCSRWETFAHSIGKAGRTVNQWPEDRGRLHPGLISWRASCESSGSGGHWVGHDDLGGGDVPAWPRCTRTSSRNAGRRRDKATRRSRSRVNPRPAHSCNHRHHDLLFQGHPGPPAFRSNSPSGDDAKSWSGVESSREGDC